ncbi:HpsJ family protein [Okeania sp.]|uniref:HpsJ family protein n=1 Tax=Okeania sp. TaxID=3100323 RepID=UPI002B4B5C2A|nr:HpsJ family protein [Okeania sp.]MEB3343688.1 HpsJ family protein [Okeania sp.]
MKGSNISPVPALAAKFMKLAGIIMVLFTIINSVLLFFPPNLGDVSWQLSFTRQIIEQGVLPIIGIALMFCGYAFEEIIGIAPAQTKVSWNSLKFWIYLLSFFFGIMFLLLIPLHINTEVMRSNQNVERLNEEAVIAQKQLEERLGERQSSLDSLLKNNQKLEEYISREQLSEEQIAELERLKNNPDALKVRTEEIRKQLIKQLEQNTQRALQNTQLAAVKSTVRIGLTSLLLASCYLTIGWSGFTGKPRRVR